MPIATLADVDLYYDSFGQAEDPALVLIAGLGSQLLRYPDELCLAFVDRGLRVVRFDNRDVGLSTHLAEGSTYTLAEMAEDVVGLLDHLAIGAGHLWGSSMGGMIAQRAAIDHPHRVRSLISVQSTTGEPGFGDAHPGAVESLLALSSPAGDRATAVDNAVRLAEILINNDQVFDAQMQRAKAEAAYDRSYDPAGSGRQLAAVLGATPRGEELAALDLPALVIHGNLDPLIGISGGRRTAELIAGATFLEIDGMGHDLNALFWSQFVDAVVAHVARIESSD